jgi:hypothetical protein
MTTPQDRTAKAREARRLNVLRRKAPEYAAALRELGYTVTEPSQRADVETLAMHCKTYGDGEIWATACRVLRSLGGNCEDQCIERCRGLCGADES